ncbi:MAG: metallophosphoesterase [Spirochaetes bacterium]|nr:metallophosphoesterase [Spirochaetota bacterium]
MIKILLTSDLHLGLGLGGEKSPVPYSSRLKTLKKLVYLAKSHDLFLIAGDFFHRTGLNQETLDIVRKEFEDLRKSGVEIVITSGEQEIDKQGESPVLNDLNASKVFFDSERLIPYKYSKENQDIFVYGLPSNSKLNISDIKKISGNGFHIGLFHADFNISRDEKDSEIIRIGKKDIISSSLDFYALGHHHQFQLFKSNDHYIGAYPGSPESVTLDEKGERYALSITVKDDEIFQIKRLTVNTSFIEHLAFDCTDSDKEALTSVIKDADPGQNKVLKIILTGTRNFRFNIKEITEKKLQSIYFEDESIPGIYLLIDEFSRDETIRGEFFKILKEKEGTDLFKKMDNKILSNVLGEIIYSGAYTLEDLCSYWSA